MKGDKQAKIDRRNKRRGIEKAHKTYKDIVDEEHKEVPNVEEKKEINEIVEEYKVEEKKVEEKKVEEKKPKRKYNKKKVVE
jgi:hypothetical protein